MKNLFWYTTALVLFVDKAYAWQVGTSSTVNGPITANDIYVVLALLLPAVLGPTIYRLWSAIVRRTRR